MISHLCSAGWKYDAQGAENLAYAIKQAKRDLGAEVQSRGLLAHIVYDGPRWLAGTLHPAYAGEIVAAALGLTGAELAGARERDSHAWADRFAALAPAAEQAA